MKITKQAWFYIFLITFIYICSIFIFNKNIFSSKFDTSLISRYFLSQDIPHEVPGKRLFLSDGDIYIATGYLYLKGSDPSEFNFEHPPLVKYLFGMSILLFNNPLIIQIILGGLLLISLYILGIKLFKKPIIPLIACILLMLDPLFINTISKPHLDLTQTLLLVLYIIFMLFHKKNFIAQGIILGLFAGTKFWVTPIFFVVILFLYKFYKKDLNLKLFTYHLIIASITYTLLYTQTFILKHGNFNIIWHILKTFKYRLDHNTSSFFGASIIMFLTGYFKTWWGSISWTWSAPWSFLWPLGLINSIYYCYLLFKKNKHNDKLLIAFIPLTYLFFLGIQAPFPRYFLIILPFIYLILAKTTYKYLKLAKKN